MKDKITKSHLLMKDSFINLKNNLNDKCTYGV